MQAAVERVLRSFSLKQPMHDAASVIDTGSDDDQATHFAAQLLENYRDQLARRGNSPDKSRQG